MAKDTKRTAKEILGGLVDKTASASGIAQQPPRHSASKATGTLNTQEVFVGGKTFCRKDGQVCMRGHTIRDYGASKCLALNEDGTYGVKPVLVQITHKDVTRCRTLQQCPRCHNTRPVESE